MADPRVEVTEPGEVELVLAWLDSLIEAAREGVAGIEAQLRGPHVSSLHVDYVAGMAALQTAEAIRSRMAGGEWRLSLSNRSRN